MTVNVDPPTYREVDAAERVLAEAHNHQPDGYWRDLARSALEAASDAGLQECITELDEMLAACRDADRTRAEDPLEIATGGTRR